MSIKATKHVRALQSLDAQTGADTNAELCKLAQSFAAHPPAQTRFIPAPYKIIAERGKHPHRYDSADIRTEDGTPFDPMQRGDIVFIRRILRSYLLPSKIVKTEQWCAAICTSITAKGRVFQIAPNGAALREEREGFNVYRVTYPWRQRAHVLFGQWFETQEQIESALETMPSSRVKAYLEAAE